MERVVQLERTRTRQISLDLSEHASWKLGFPLAVHMALGQEPLYG
jgi:hypothetical protein